MKNLEDIADRIESRLEEKDQVREVAINIDAREAEARNERKR